MSPKQDCPVCSEPAELFDMRDSEEQLGIDTMTDSKGLIISYREKTIRETIARPCGCEFLTIVD